MLYGSGIDALSFTMLADTDASEWVRSLYRQYVEQDREAGNDVRECGRHGFEGTGSKHVFWGNGGKFDFFEVKSNAADEIANVLRNNDLPIKATRTDWAVTFANHQESAEYANNLRKHVKEKLLTDSTPHPGRTALWESENNGNTYYIMTGDKSVMHRTYNKAVESPGEYPPDAWRHELQLKGIRARRAFEEFRQSSGSDYLSRGYVAAFLMQYGIFEPWMNDVEPCKHPGKKQQSDTDRRLQWFEGTALPVLEKLLAGGVTQSAIVRILQRAGLDIVEQENKF
jgi:hypothetical protein